MAFHAKKSPSKTDQFAACAGSLALCEALPDHQKNISGPAAQLGTCVHTLIEESLQRNVEPESFRGRIVMIDLEDNGKILPKSAKTPRNAIWFEVDDDMIEGATLHTDYVRRRCRELGIDPTNRDEVQLESRTNPLAGERPDEETSGSADTTILAWPTMLELVDYKNGWNVVEHDGNKQVLSYLLGKAIEHEWAFARYRLTIVQPNAEHSEGKERSVEVSEKELRAHQDQLRGWVEMVDEAADAKGAPKPGFETVSPVWAKKYLRAAKPGSGEKDHCMFCDAKPRCPAYIAMRQNEAAMDFDDEPKALPAPENGAQVANILRWKPSFDALFRAAVAYGQRDLENGFKLPGFKLVKTKPHPKLKPMATDELVAAICKTFKLTREDLFHEVMKTGAKIRDSLPKAQRAKFVEKFMFQPEGVNVIAPDDDARQEVIKNAGDDFPDDDNGEIDFG